MSNVGREKVIYCDTDSIWSHMGNDTGPNGADIVNSERMGELRFVGKYNSLEFRGLKHYTADGSVSPTSRGIHGAIGHMVSSGITGNTGIMESCTLGISPRIERAKVDYMKCKPYEHGKVLETGQVIPLVLDED